jgi:hypothetical protein
VLGGAMRKEEEDYLIASRVYEKIDIENERR